jgi:hypothetical protein
MRIREADFIVALSGSIGPTNKCFRAALFDGQESPDVARITRDFVEVFWPSMGSHAHRTNGTLLRQSACRLLPLPDRHVVCRLTACVYPLGRTRSEFPVFGKHRPGRDKDFARFLLCRFDGGCVDPVEGNGIAPIGSHTAVGVVLAVVIRGVRIEDAAPIGPDPLSGLLYTLIAPCLNRECDTLRRQVRRIVFRFRQVQFPRPDAWVLVSVGPLCGSDVRRPCCQCEHGDSGDHPGNIRAFHTDLLLKKGEPAVGQHRSDDGPNFRDPTASPTQRCC